MPMEKVLIDFIQELLDSEGIPHRRVDVPCEDWDWVDFGLRGRLLGMAEPLQLLNETCLSLREDTLYHYTDLFQCNYSILRLPEDASDSFLVLGPVLFEPIQGERFETLFQDLELPQQLQETLRGHYRNIPLIPFPAHYESMVAVIASHIFCKRPCQIIYRSEDDFENLRHHYRGIARVPEQPFLSIQRLEDRYQIENALLAAVVHCNEALAVEQTRKLSNVPMPQRLTNGLRDKKDLTITLNSLLRKAVEQAGVHPIHIDSFSNQSIQQIEQLASIEQCHSFQKKLALGYCRLVKRYSLKGYSLPVQRVVTYVSTDLSVDLGLKTLANQLNVTPSYLSSLFRKEMGMTLTDYVTQQRISHAQQLLLGTSLPIKSIALQCGIPDLNYFARMFKRSCGVTPKHYRDTASHKFE